MVPIVVPVAKRLRRSLFRRAATAVFAGAVIAIIVVLT
jgi:uncharacterized membrane protein